jgi:hypothetical protein
MVVVHLAIDGPICLKERSWTGFERLVRVDWIGEGACGKTGRQADGCACGRGWYVSARLTVVRGIEGEVS